MTKSFGKLSIGMLFVAAGLASACSSGSSSGSPGAAGTSGSAGTTGGAGTTGAAGTTGSAGTTGAAGANATPTELVSAPDCGNIRLVLASGTIYYTNYKAGTVSSVPVAGGTPKVIAMGQSKPNPIAVDATNVYWGNDGDRTVMKQAITNGTAGSFVPAPTDTDATNLVNALLVDGTTLFVGRGLDTYKIPTAGGTLTHLSHSAENGSPGALAFDGTYLFQTEINHNAVTREVIDGTQKGAITDGSLVALAPDRIAVSRSSLATDVIAVSGQQVVWGNDQGVEIHDKGTLTGTLTQIATTANFGTITGFVISGGKIYMGETENSVDVVPLSFTVGADGAPNATVLVANQPHPAQFAADDTNIYYTTHDAASGACKIMKLKK